MGQRTWFKIYTKKWLRGSIREESPAIRGIWVDLLALAANGDYGDIGTIQLADDVGFTDKQIIKILKISEEEWFEAKNCLLDSERITVHNDSDVIQIINWQKYQSEYERQKVYRIDDVSKRKKEAKKEKPLQDQNQDQDRELEKRERSDKREKREGDKNKSPSLVTKSNNKKLQEEVTIKSDEINIESDKCLQLNDFLALYNGICTKLTEADRLTNKRREKIQTRLKENPEISFWKKVFEKANNTPFLYGENKRGWCADLDFFIKNDTNAIKVLEGSYGEKRHAGIEAWLAEMEEEQNGQERL